MIKKNIKSHFFLENQKENGCAEQEDQKGTQVHSTRKKELGNLF